MKKIFLVLFAFFNLAVNASAAPTHFQINQLKNTNNDFFWSIDNPKTDSVIIHNDEHLLIKMLISVSRNFDNDKPSDGIILTCGQMPPLHVNAGDSTLCLSEDDVKWVDDHHYENGSQGRFTVEFVDGMKNSQRK